MLGAIAGDIIGSVFEHHRTKSKDFELFQPYSRFTDDTVMTIAVAHSILEEEDHAFGMKRFGREYPDAGYGSSFHGWLSEDETHPYGSYGNGSAMRVSPIGWAFDSEDRVLAEAQRSAAVSHDHPEGIKGAQAVALALFMARKGNDKERLRSRLAEQFGYDLGRTVDAIRPLYRFEVSCQRSVPEAIIAFLDSTSYEDAIRNAISLGGDSDTLACIAGGISEADYGGIPADIAASARRYMPPLLLSVLDKFYEVYC